MQVAKSVLEGKYSDFTLHLGSAYTLPLHKNLLESSPFFANMFDDLPGCKELTITEKEPGILRSVIYSLYGIPLPYGDDYHKLHVIKYKDLLQLPLDFRELFYLRVPANCYSLLIEVITPMLDLHPNLIHLLRINVPQYMLPIELQGPQVVTASIENGHIVVFNAALNKTLYKVRIMTGYKYHVVSSTGVLAIQHKTLEIEFIDATGTIGSLEGVIRCNSPELLLIEDKGLELYDFGLTFIESYKDMIGNNYLISPDSNKIAYTRGEELCIYDRTTKAVVSQSIGYGKPRFTIDSKYVIYGEAIYDVKKLKFVSMCTKLKSQHTRGFATSKEQVYVYDNGKLYQF